MQFKDRRETLEKIEAFKIASGDIAKLGEVPIQRISDYKADRRVEGKQAAKIEDAVHQIYTVLSELNPVKIDCRDPESIRRAFSEVTKTRIEQATATYVEQAEIGLAQSMSS